MQAVANRRRSRAGRANPGVLKRAIGYLGRQRRTAIIAYSALLIATLAQLTVPHLVENMINAIANGFRAQQVLNLPPLLQSAAAAVQGTSVDAMQTAYDSAETLLVNAVITIVIFAVIRGLFAFIQTYMAETTSQGVAYHMRNDIFSKIQRLSFSYYDRTQTGQLMIRATDDVEKVRLFIAQGLILTVQAFLLLSITLLILFATNWRLTLAILPVLPVALVLFMIFGAVAQPLFMELQRRLSTLNTILQENVAGITRGQGFRARAGRARALRQIDRRFLRPADADQPDLLDSVPGDLRAGEYRSGGHPVLCREADYPR